MIVVGRVRCSSRKAVLLGYSSEYLGVSLDTGNNLSILDDPMETIEKLAPCGPASGPASWSVAFAADGNIFYTTRDGEPQQSVSLWTVTIDSRSGARAGQPVLLARWPGAVAAEPLTISADGRRLGLTKQFAQSDVHLLTLNAAGQAVTAARQLTTDTQVDWPAQ